VAGLAVAALACSPAVSARAARPANGAAAHEVLVSGAKWAQGVTVSLHDVLIVPPPAEYDAWRVHVASAAVVRLLTPADRVRHPPAAGWRFEAVGRGETTVTCVPLVPSEKSSSSPNEPHFTLRVTVR
jgi:hypothetical protein